MKPRAKEVATVSWGWTKGKGGIASSTFFIGTVPDFWAGFFKRGNTQFPLGTSGADVLRFIDEGIKIQGKRLKKGLNDIDYGNGRTAQMWIDDDLNINGFYPIQWPSSFEMKDTYVAPGLR